jgi:hypothetical protein
MTACDHPKPPFDPFAIESEFVEIGFPAFRSAEMAAVPPMPDQAEPASAVGAALLHHTPPGAT